MRAAPQMEYSETVNTKSGPRLIRQGGWPPGWRSAVWLVGCAMGIVPSAGKDAGDGFVPLFDGKTLNGWVARENEPLWRVVDGVIDCLRRRTMRSRSSRFRGRIQLNDLT